VSLKPSCHKAVAKDEAERPAAVPGDCSDRLTMANGVDKNKLRTGQNWPAFGRFIRWLSGCYADSGRLLTPMSNSL
jgi:hypothetical protein